MDLTIFLFLAVIVLLGGVIADLADRLGRKLGKKRLSLFGLRPRHTAEVITVAAGILIPLFTIVVLYAFSSDVRTWIQAGPRVVAERDQLLKDVAAARAERERLVAARTQLDEDIKALRTERGSLQEKLANERTIVRKQTELVSKLREQSQTLRSQTASLNSQLTRLSSQVTTLTANYETVSGQVFQAKKDLTEARAEYDKSKELSDFLMATQKDLVDQNNSLIRETSDLEKEKNRLELNKTALETDVNRLTDERRELNNKLELSRIELDRSKAILDEANRQLQYIQVLLEQNLNKSRFQPLIHSRMEEVARLPVPAGMTADEARARLTTLLREARLEAERRGALSDNPKLPAAGLFERQIEDPKRTLTVQEQEDEIVKGLTNQKDDLVLIAYSSLNAFKGEFVALDIQAFRNPVVYRAGQTLAETRVDGRMGEDVIFQQIADFLHTKVSARAKQDNMIPFAGRDSQFGEMTTQEMLQLVKLIKIDGGTVRLIAYTDAETRAAGPLRIQFRVR